MAAGSPLSAERPHEVAPGDGAIDAVATLLDALRRAMIAGDLPAMEASRTRLHGLLAEPASRRGVAPLASAARLGGVLASASVAAGVAARGEAQAARALQALTPSPSLYTASGALGARGGAARGRSA
jgi:hypothetical protein